MSESESVLKRCMHLLRVQFAPVLLVTIASFLLVPLLFMLFRAVILSQPGAQQGPLAMWESSSPVAKTIAVLIVLLTIFLPPSLTEAGIATIALAEAKNEPVGIGRLFKHLAKRFPGILLLALILGFVELMGSATGIISLGIGLICALVMQVAGSTRLGLWTSVRTGVKLALARIGPIALVFFLTLAAVIPLAFAFSAVFGRVLDRSSDNPRFLLQLRLLEVGLIFVVAGISMIRSSLMAVIYVDAVKECSLPLQLEGRRDRILESDPLSIQAWTMLRKHWMSLMILSLWPALAVEVVWLVCGASLHDLAFLRDTGVLISAMAFLLFTVQLDIAEAGVSSITGMECEGEMIEMRQFLSWFAKRAPQLLLSSIALGIVKLLGTICLILPGLFAASYTSLVGPTIAITDLGFAGALRKALKMAGKRFRLLLGVNLLSWLAFLVPLLLYVSSVAYSPVGSTWRTGRGLVLSTTLFLAAMGVIVMVRSVFVTLAYFKIERQSGVTQIPSHS